MHQRIVLTLAALPIGPFTALNAAETKPNILYLLADDLGYADIGANGCTDVPTPNLDSIAKHGVRFTNGYVSAPVCSPSRAGLMTGRASAMNSIIRWPQGLRPAHGGGEVTHGAA
jgi:arylsulfatase A-like enzyme